MHTDTHSVTLSCSYYYSVFQLLNLFNYALYIPRGPCTRNLDVVVIQRYSRTTPSLSRPGPGLAVFTLRHQTHFSRRVDPSSELFLRQQQQQRRRQGGGAPAASAATAHCALGWLALCTLSLSLSLSLFFLGRPSRFPLRPTPPAYFGTGSGHFRTTPKHFSTRISCTLQRTIYAI